MIEAQLQTSHEFKKHLDELLKSLGDFPKPTNKKVIPLKAALVNTVLGPMLAIADDNLLYLLEFITRKGLMREIERLRCQGFTIVPGNTRTLVSIKNELKAYFDGTLTQFKTNFHLFASPFQHQVWQALCHIPYGETRSYAEQATLLGKPRSYRAVANANGANQLALIIPCHRVIASDGTLGGYGGGLVIKQWLIEHEKRHHIV